MVIFQNFENFCGFLFFVFVINGIAALLLVMCIDLIDFIAGKKEPEEQPEDVQAFIDGIENAIDNGWDFPGEDFEEYKRLTEDS